MPTIPSSTLRLDGSDLTWLLNWSYEILIWNVGQTSTHTKKQTSQQIHSTMQQLMVESGRFKSGNKWRVMKERDRKQLQTDDESVSVCQPPFTPAHLGALQQKWKPVYLEENMLVLVFFLLELTGKKEQKPTSIFFSLRHTRTLCPRQQLDLNAPQRLQQMANKYTHSPPTFQEVATTWWTIQNLFKRTGRRQARARTRTTARGGSFKIKQEMSRNSEGNRGSKDRK